MKEAIYLALWQASLERHPHRQPSLEYNEGRILTREIIEDNYLYSTVMRMASQHSASDIAEILGQKVSTVRALLRRARGEVVARRAAAKGVKPPHAKKHPAA